VNEAKNLNCFREQLEGIEWVTVPRVYHEFSSDRTLTMSFIEGRTLGGFLETGSSRQFQRNSQTSRRWENPKGGLVVSYTPGRRRMRVEVHPSNPRKIRRKLLSLTPVTV
jgi:hypothetical protein